MQANLQLQLGVATLLLASLLGPLAPRAAAAPISSTYNVSFITTPATASGDVIAVGGAVFVGSGGFGAQSLVRIDSGGTTVLADGFSAISGIAYDAVNDRLIVGDNGTGSLTGDTVYGVSNPFGSPITPAGAAGLELLPIGSTPGVSDVLIDPTDPTGNTLFVSDASEAFPPLGEILQVTLSSQTLVSVQTGLHFASGLGSNGSTLFFGDTSVIDFSGNVSSVALASPGAVAAFIGNYPGGMFDLELASDGSILITSGGSILRIDPLTGTPTEVASGFGFAAGLFVSADGTIYAVDGFASAGEENRVWVFTAIPEPGSGVLLGAGLAAFAQRRRRARQSGSRSEKRTGTVTRP